MASNSSSPFTYAYYSEMLKCAVDDGYHISSFAKFDFAQERTILLRHDVDYTLDGLMQFATIESELGCCATYLFRVHSDEYNLFSATSMNIVSRILDLGHEVGLHFEAMNVGRALGITPEELLLREKNALESMLGFKVLTCSEHRELSGTIHETPLYDSLYDPYVAGFAYYAMDPKYCSDMKYLSDSNANWREGDLLAHLGRHQRLQVLVHADWWFESDLLLKGPYYHPRGTHI